MQVSTALTRQPSPIPSHAQICCDDLHSITASTSTSASASASSTTSIPSTPTLRPSSGQLSAVKTSCCKIEGDEECCVDMGCGDLGAAGNDGEGRISDSALEEWACSKEGCKAIQQYVSPAASPHLSHTAGRIATILSLIYPYHTKPTTFDPLLSRLCTSMLRSDIEEGTRTRYL
jgi:hypothetical protein